MRAIMSARRVTRSISSIARAGIVTVAVVAAAGAALLAQRGQSQDPDWRPRIWVGGGRFYREPPRWAKASDFDGQFNYCRGFYQSNRPEDRKSVV